MRSSKRDAWCVCDRSQNDPSTLRANSSLLVCDDAPTIYASLTDPAYEIGSLASAKCRPTLLSRESVVTNACGLKIFSRARFFLRSLEKHDDSFALIDVIIREFPLRSQ